MQDNHFIKNIEIKNFKCFENFSAEGFGRVNLIGGKNNVGKTAFMEAVFVNVFSTDVKKFATSLSIVKQMRENLNLLQMFNDNTIDRKKTILDYIELAKGIFVNSTHNNITFDIQELNSIKNYIFTINNDIIKVNVNEYSFIYSASDGVGFIDNFGLSNIEIISNYSFIQKKDEELYLNRIINIFDERIEVFKIIDEKPQCKINGKYIEITELGDGVRHLVSIVTALYASENGYLFIDEIDNGIHYTMLDELWRVVLDVSKKLDVQVFATTHSKEGIESFNRVQLEREDKETYYFEMYRNLKQNNIEMRALDSNQLEYELTHQGRYRGE